MTDADADFAIVGGGPAGLHAALKAALLRLSAVLLDKGRRTNRIFFAKQVDNIPGFPGGIDGSELLAKQREHIEWVQEAYAPDLVDLVDDVEVTDVERDGDLFVVDGEGMDEPVRARAVILATGVVDRQPWIGDVGEIAPVFPFANKGIVEYCLLCDGHKVLGEDVAVIGFDRTALGTATSLKEGFDPASVTLVNCIACAVQDPDHEDTDHEQLIADAREAGLEVVDKTITGLSGHREDELTIEYADGSDQTFDVGFVSMGWQQVNNELAVQLDAAIDDEGYVETTGDCEVVDGDGEPLEGVYCIGDLRSEVWNQIPIHFGDAETVVIHAYVHRLWEE